MQFLLLLGMLLTLLICVALLAAVIAWFPYPRVLQALLIILGCGPLALAGRHVYSLSQLSTSGHGGGPEAMIGAFLIWLIPWLLIAAGLCFALAFFLPTLHGWLRDRVLPELRPYTVSND